MAFESGIRPLRIGFIREVDGEIPENPEWLPYSNTINNTSADPQVTMSERRRVGSPDVQNFSGGSEDHSWNISYDLQQWLIDGNGDPLDAAYDGMMRNDNGEIFHTHAILQRTLLGGPGKLGAGARAYHVGLGAKVNTVNFDADPDSGDPVVITLDYLVNKYRVYRIDQPDEPMTLTIESTSSADTTQEITIEEDEGGNSETIQLNGTTPVTTSGDFASIDAALLSAECQGTVTIKAPDDTVLMEIFGRDDYQDREGDLGVPLLGSGSHAEDLPETAYEFLLGDEIIRGGSPFMNDVDIASIGLTIENNIDPQPSHKTIGKRLNEGDRDVQLNASIYGNSASYDTMIEHLQIKQIDIEWNMTGGTLTFPGATLTDPGSVQFETSQATLSIENTFTAKGMEIS